MESNIISANFGGYYKVMTDPAWLVDHGMQLAISGIDLPDEFECHFSNSRSVAAKRQIGSDGVVTIPDEYFLSGEQQIFCWIYLHPTVDSGVTEYEICIPLRKRPTVDPAEPTQEQQDIVDQAIAALNVAMAATSADAESASASATAAQAAVDSVLNMTVSADTLPSGSGASVTKSVVDDAVHLAFGIPQGAQGVQGEQGVQGPTGATPNFTIGTVQTLLPTQDATATITGTAEAPVLNLGIPKGYSGDATNLAADYSSNKIYAVGEYCIYNGSLYRCTTPITTAEAWTAAHWTAAVLGEDVGDLRSAINDHTSQIYSIGTELIGEIQTKNVRYYDLWQAPKQGSVLTFKNVGTINGILGATKQNGTFQNLIAFTSDVKEGTYTFDEQFKSIGFYGYQTGTVKIAVTGANFDMINENIIKNVGEETWPKFSELSGDIYDISVIKFANIEEANTRLYNLWLPPAPGTYVVENLGLNFIFGGIKSNGSVVDLAVFNSSNPRTQTVTVTETLKSIGVYTYATGNVKFKISGTAFSHLDKLAGKKVMFFGDSITADENRYRKWLLQNTGMELVESFAVSGATLTNYDDTVMDGNPTYGNHSNTVPNQVQKLINGTYSTVPDIVVVSAGTNDYYGKFNGGLNEAQFAVPDGTISSLAVYIDVDTCDLTTPSGAMRWIYEKIISVYPNTQVFFATPTQRATYPSLFTYLKTKHDTICEIAERMSCCVIDATYKSGIYSRYENNGASGKYLADGLHPNTDGGKLLAKCYEDEIRNNLHLVEQA